MLSSFFSIATIAEECGERRNSWASYAVSSRKPKVKARGAQGHWGPGQGLQLQGVHAQ